MPSKANKLPQQPGTLKPQRLPTYLLRINYTFWDREEKMRYACPHATTDIAPANTDAITKVLTNQNVFPRGLMLAAAGLPPAEPVGVSPAEVLAFSRVDLQVLSD